MQRMFSMFPSGWPGTGLFLLRLAAGVPLIIGGGLELRGLTQSGLHATPFAAIGIGILLLAGLWTPVVGALQAIFETWMAFSPGDAPVLHILLAALGISLVMLGPGGWSVDARLYGRKRIVIRKR